MSSPGSSPKVGSDATGPGFDSNLVWFNYPNGKEKIEYIDEVAGALGKCYVRCAIFCSELARLPLEEFKKVIDEFSRMLGEHPLGHDVFVELAVLNNLGLTDQAARRLPDAMLRGIYDEIQKSKARILISRIENSDLFHAHVLKPHPFCECQGPVCEHGWNARMCMVVLGLHGRRIGASGFDLNAFLEEMEGGGETTFEDSFSEVTATPKAPPKEKTQASKMEVDTKNRDILMSSLMAQLAASEAKVKTLQDTFSEPKRPATPPEPEYYVPRHSNGSPMSLGPDDSSSVIERYERRFMNQGTVFSIKEQALNQQFKSPKLVVDDGLVSGFTVTPAMARRESERVSKLTPINGLPRPFTNTRLNFLCNFHTAMTGRISKGDGNHLESLYRAMRDTPRLPHDNLLQQVLLTSIDMSTKTWCSNAFELPYIEVGMLFTEDSVVKMFDLLQLEYKRIWFQEFKSLVVPSFHGDYKNVSTSVLSSRGRGSNSAHKEVTTSESRKKRGSRSVLGF